MTRAIDSQELYDIGEYLKENEDKFRAIYEGIRVRGLFSEPSEFFYTEDGEQVFEYLAYELDDLWTGGDGWITVEDVIKVYRYGLVLEEAGYFSVYEFKEAVQEFHRSYMEWCADEAERVYREYSENLKAEQSMYYFRSV